MWIDLCVFAARETAGKLCGLVVAAVKPAGAEQLLQELLAGFADQDIKKHKFELQDGCMSATGYVLAQCKTGQQMHLQHPLHLPCSVAALY